MAALETVLALQALAGDRLEIELLAPGRHFTYRPLAVAEPFRNGSVLRVPLAAIAADRGIAAAPRRARARTGRRSRRRDPGRRPAGLRHARARARRPARRGRPRRADLPRAAGRRPRGCDRRSSARRHDAARRLRRPERRPPGRCRCTSSRCRPRRPCGSPRHGLELVLVTPEPTPLAAFGDAAGAAVGALLEQRGVELRTGALVDEYDRGRLWLGTGGSLAVDAVIALPRLIGPHVRGVPSDPLGFAPVDELHPRDRDRRRPRGRRHRGARPQAGRAGRPAGRRGRRTRSPPPPAPRYGRSHTGRCCAGCCSPAARSRYLRNAADGRRRRLSSDPLWWPPAKIAGRTSRRTWPRTSSSGAPPARDRRGSLGSRPWWNRFAS